jgi:DNA-binding NtrC family response regulator
MAQKFAEHAFTSRNKKFSGFTDDALTAISNYRWPGNVRELLNVMERVALVWNTTGQVSAQSLSLPTASIGSGFAPRLASADVSGDSNYPSFDLRNFEGDVSTMTYTEIKKVWSDKFELQYLISTLQRNGGNVSAAARESKIDRSNFLRLLRRHGLKAEAYRAHDADTAGTENTDKIAA